MRMRTGFTLVELLVVLVALLVIGTIVYPIIMSNRRRHQRPMCNDNVHQIARAIQMYAQDNNSQYPGIDGNSWPSKIAPYLYHSPAMFYCNSDKSAEIGDNSYAMSGLLVRENGRGVKESQVLSPSEVGAIVDTEPTETYPNGRIIGGGGQQDMKAMSATIETRHSKGAVVGFCDGHVKYFQGAINLKDDANGAVRALYHAAPLQLVDNPVGCIPGGCSIGGLKGTVTVGGEYATYPLLMGAAKMYGDYYTLGFKGQYFMLGRPSSNWVWGTGCTGPQAVAATAIAYDAMLVIVAKGSKIPTLPALANNTYAVRPSYIRGLFETGYEKDTVQVYVMPSGACSTNAYVKGVIGNKNWGVDAVGVANDAEMIEKVSNDPYGIGYCSSAFFDPDRVVALAPVIRGKTYVWPRADAKFRWLMPTMKASDWPWKRSLDVVNSKDQLGAGIAAALRTGDFVKKGLYPGPLFTWGYWVGNY